MLLVSLNTWGGRREHELLSWLRSGDADIYCFQEMFSGPALAPEDQYREDDDGHRVNLRLFEDISGVLSGYKGFFSGGSSGYVNDSQWLDLPFEYGIAVFIRAAVVIDAYAAGMVHDSYRRGPDGSPPLSRSAQAVRCRYDGTYMTVGNIHGLWDPHGKMDTVARSAQARRFGQLIDSVALSSDGILACGDFNLQPDSACFVKSQYDVTVNQVLEHGITSTRNALYTKPVRFADYILTNRQVRVARLEAPQQPLLSDHCPLIAYIDPAHQQTESPPST